MKPAVPSVVSKPVVLETKSQRRVTANKRPGSKMDTFFMDENKQDITVKFELAGFQTAPEVVASYGTRCLLKVEQTFHILIDHDDEKGSCNVLRWFVENERIVFVSEEQSLVIFAQVGGKINLVFDMDTGSFIGSLQLQDGERIECVNTSAVLTSVQATDSTPSYYLFRLNSNISKFSERSPISIPDVAGPVQLAKAGLALLINMPMRNAASVTNRKKGIPESGTGPVRASTYVRTIHWLGDQGVQKAVIPSSVNHVQLIRPDLVIFHSKESGKSTLHLVDYDNQDFPVIKTLCERGSQPIVELDLSIYVKDNEDRLTIFILNPDKDVHSLKSAFAANPSAAVLDQIFEGQVSPDCAIYPSPTLESSGGVAAMAVTSDISTVIPTTMIYQGYSQLRFNDSPVYELNRLPACGQLTEVNLN